MGENRPWNIILKGCRYHLVKVGYLYLNLGPSYGVFKNLGPRLYQLLYLHQVWSILAVILSDVFFVHILRPIVGSKPNFSMLYVSLLRMYRSIFCQIRQLGSEMQINRLEARSICSIKKLNLAYIYALDRFAVALARSAS